jgi:hypothetical protein
MKKKTTNDKYDLKNWTHSSAVELKSFKKAIEKKLGVKLGPPFKKAEEKYIPTYIKLNPKIVKWAKREALKKGIGYQTVINNELLKKVA